MHRAGYRSVQIAMLITLLMEGCGSSAVDDDSSPAGESPTPSGTPSGTPSVTPSPVPSPTPSPTPGTTPGPTPSPTPGTTPSPTPWPAANLVLVANNGANQYQVLEPESQRVVSNVDLSLIQPALCPSRSNCFEYVGIHQVLEGHDYLTMSYGQPYQQTLGPGFNGNITRVLMSTPPTVRWRLHELDFSGLPDPSISHCVTKPGDPCSADSSLATDQQGYCWVGDAHDFEVISDDPVAQRAEIMVTDTDNYRMFTATLDYAGGNTCGRVTSMVNTDTHPENWFPGSQANSTVHAPPRDDGRDLWIIALRAITHVDNADSDGLIQLWELEPDGTWVHRWTFPGQDDGGEMHTLYLPHGGELVPADEPGGYYYRFADSGSLSAERIDDVSHAPPGGSIVTLYLEDLLSPPDYMHDLYQPPGDGVWSFPRSINRVEDGTLLFSDSGCQGQLQCEIPSRLVWIRDVERLNSPKAGYWTPDHSQLEFVDQTANLVKTLECGFVSPYDAQTIPVSEQGAELTAALSTEGSACP